jgi:hypothetical protein
MSTLRGRVRTLVLCAGLGVALAPVSAQNIWQPQNIWDIPAPEFVFNEPAGADTNYNVFRRGTGFQNPATGGRTSYALVTNGTGFAREDGNAIRDRVEIVFGRYDHIFNLNADAGARADIVMPVLAEGRLTWAGGANNQARFKVQVEVQLLRQDDRPNPLAPLPGTYSPVGAAVTLDSGWKNEPFFGGPRDISQTWMQRFANQPTGERRYKIETTVKMIAQADSAGVLGGNGTRVDFDFNSANSATARGVTQSVTAEPANYANANSRNVVAADWASRRFGVTGDGVTIGIIEPGKASNHADFGARLTRVNGGGPAGNNYDSEHTTAVASIIGSGSADTKRRGVAPGASMVTNDTSDHGGTINAINDMVTNRMGAAPKGVINFSMSGGIANGEGLDSIINANQNVSFVWAAGNQRVNPNPAFNYVGTVPNPAYAYNNIAVGALDSTFARMEDFSSNTQGNLPTKPDVVAPGGYVLSASNRDLDNDGTLNDYTRSFVANQWSKTLNPNSPRYPEMGRISGTSFAAPHVAGIVGLLHEYANDRPANYDNRAVDQRVMKAALIAGAVTTGVVDADGLTWRQQGKTGNLSVANPTRVPNSLDTTLGGGVANAYSALEIFANKEARAGDNNADRHLKIDLRPTMSERNGFWDLETVQPKQGARSGTVDYMLGGGAIAPDFPGGDQQGVTAPISYLRVALTWNRTVTAGVYDALANLELNLFLDGFTQNNLPGWDPAFGEADAVDYKLASTENVNENVKLFDFAIPSLWFFGLDLPALNNEPINRVGLTFGNMYLQVRNNSNVAVEYGIAASFITVPTPTGVALLGVVGIVATRRRRR